MSCPCGLTGAMCTTLLAGVSDLSEIVEGPCVNGECKAVSGSATCVCDPGYRDETCDREAEALTWNYAIAIGVPVLILILCSLLLWKKARGTFDVPSAISTRSPWRWAGPRVVLAYRSVVLIFWIVLQMRQQVRVSYYSLKAFTVWNSYLLLVYFLLGTFLSARAVKTEPTGIAGRLERVHWVLSQVEFASVMLVACVTWFILLPAARSAGNEEAVVNFESFFQHGINVAIMGIDFFMCGYISVPAHLPFLWAWGALYAFFHGLYMLSRDLVGKPLDPVYDFLTTESELLIVWLLGLLLVLTIFGGVEYLLSLLKRRCAADNLAPLILLELQGSGDVKISP